METRRLRPSRQLVRCVTSILCQRVGPTHRSRSAAAFYTSQQVHRTQKRLKSSIPKQLGDENTSRRSITAKPFIKVSDEVRDALQNNKPVIALESTIYTHGFPFPDNVKLALDLEKVARECGVIPATIGIIEGVATVGLSEDELNILASAGGKGKAMKISRRDLPFILASVGQASKRLSGGTTVAATMLLAHSCGIRIFATGGIGGVHRGGQDSMDVSADLTELGRTGMAVIASGCKSFLDIPRTLEYLETQGVTVATVSTAPSHGGQVVNVPAFYTQDSGIRSPSMTYGPEHAAQMIYAQEALGPSFGSGILFANPIPDEFAIPKEKIDVAINLAVKEAAEQGFHGNTNTPFILARIKELTDGQSIPANRALIESNVKFASSVAISLAALNEEAQNGSRLSNNNITQGLLPSNRDKKPTSQNMVNITEKITSSSSVVSATIKVYGSVAIDLSCDYLPDSKECKSDALSPRMHTSNVAAISSTIGGVGHNVALAANRASSNLNVQLCSFVGNDLAGTTILSTLQEEGLDISSIRTLESRSSLHGKGDPVKSSQNRTAQYVSVNDGKKSLVLAMADMAIFDTNVYEVGASTKASARKHQWSVVDSNWRPSKIRQLIAKVKKSSKVAYEPVSVQKSGRTFQPSDPKSNLPTFPNHIIDLSTPNQYELAAMYEAAKKYGHFESQEWWHIIDSLGIPSSGARNRFVHITNVELTDKGIPLQSVQLLSYIPTILTKLGSDGVLLTELLLPDDSRLTDPDSAPYILSRCNNGSIEVGGVYMRLFPAAEVVEDVVSVNGVGDTFLGVLISGLARGLKLNDELIDIAQRGAVMTLRSREAVSPDLGLLAGELDDLVR